MKMNNNQQYNNNQPNNNNNQSNNNNQHVFMQRTIIQKNDIKPIEGVKNNNMKRKYIDLEEEEEEEADYDSSSLGDIEFIDDELPVFQAADDDDDDDDDDYKPQANNKPKKPNQKELKARVEDAIIQFENSSYTKQVLIQHLASLSNDSLYRFEFASPMRDIEDLIIEKIKMKYPNPCQKAIDALTVDIDTISAAHDRLKTKDKNEKIQMRAEWLHLFYNFAVMCIKHEFIVTIEFGPFEVPWTTYLPEMSLPIHELENKAVDIKIVDYKNTAAGIIYECVKVRDTNAINNRLLTTPERTRKFSLCLRKSVKFNKHGSVTLAGATGAGASNPRFEFTSAEGHDSGKHFFTVYDEYSYFKRWWTRENKIIAKIALKKYRIVEDPKNPNAATANKGIPNEIIEKIVGYIKYTGSLYAVDSSSL